MKTTPLDECRKICWQADDGGWRSGYIVASNGNPDWLIAFDEHRREIVLMSNADAKKVVRRDDDGNPAEQEQAREAARQVPGA